MAVLHHGFGRHARVPSLSAAALALTCAACGDRSGAAPATADPRRIVALTIGSVDTLDVLGELGRAIAVEADCFVSGTEHLVRIRNDDHSGPSQAVNVEAVIALRPDLVLAKEELRPALAARGLDVLFLPARADLTTVVDLVERIGERIGARAKATEVAAAMRARIAQLRATTAKLPPVRVYYEAGRPGRTTGKGTLLHDLIELAGGVNIAADVAIANPMLSAEAILARDPEVIVLSPWSDAPEVVAARPGWRRITAVRDGRVHRIREDRRQLQSASPRCLDACERELLPWLHPDLTSAAAGRK